MKPIKMLGLAAVAALMAMSFVGASAAMAEETMLCAEDKDPCESGVMHVHETTLNGKSALLKAGSNNVECDALFLGDVVAEGAPLVIEGKFTYSNCNSGCTAVEENEENGPSTIEVLKLGHETADVTGEGLVHVKCSFIDCSYDGIGLQGSGKGPLLSSETNGEVSLSGQKTHEEGEKILCPDEGLLTITTTPLVKTYIGKAKMVCINVGANNGLYLSAGTGGSCASKDAERKGAYELGTALTSEAGKHVCALVGKNKGFFPSLNANGTECTNVERTGRYELGTVS